MASTMLDLPQPLGPMMQVTTAAEGDLSLLTERFEAHQLDLRSFSKISPLWPPPSYAGSF